MKQEMIQLLINMFKNGYDIVWVTDENWKIQNIRYSDEKTLNLPELLHVAADSWENMETEMFWNGQFYYCRLYCSPENQCRAVILKRPEKDKPEISPVNNAVHSLRQMKEKLAEYMEENNLYDDMPILDSVERNCLLVYRKSYLEKKLKSVRNGTDDKITFSVQNIIRETEPRIQRELGKYAEIILSLSKENVFLHEDIDFFWAVLLAGVTLCHQEPGYFHEIVFSLGSSGSRAELLINLTPNYQKPIDMTHQIDAQNFGSYKLEELLLDMFCMIHQGNWKLMKHSENGRLISVCCQIKFRQDDSDIELVFRSPKRIMRPDFDDVYRIMLSRVYLSHF